MLDSDSVQGIDRVAELNTVGAKLFAQGHIEPARLHFLAALSIDPTHFMSLQNLGAALRTLGHYAAAESVARRSVVSAPDNPYCRSNLGVSQLHLKKFSEAIATLKSVLVDLPESGPSWHNYGLSLYMTGKLDEAMVAFNTALSFDASNYQAQSDRALALLSLGKIQEALAAYEVRWKLLHRNKIWSMGLPEWQGEALLGQRLLVHHEQGFGDSIMLVRFVKALAKLGGSITLAVPQELVKLFKRSYRFVKVIDMTDEILNAPENFDYHTPLLSTMRWLGLQKPSEIDPQAYLFAKPMQFLKLPDAKMKIGVCWASGNHGPALLERRRVVPLVSFLPLTELPSVSLISLQKGDEAKDILKNGLEGIVFDISAKLEDFAATADVIAHLDLVISVDSAVAHLAGAIGKPCLMLSPYTRCWRWWNKNIGWPWYSRMLVYHQSPSGSWDEAMGKVVKEVRSRG